MGFFRRNGLSLVTFALFLIFLVGQTFAGMAEFNEERQGDEKPRVGLSEYLGEGHFLEAVTEN